jgi:YcxB-like protein
MQIEYVLTPDDWAAFGEYHARHSPHFQRVKNQAVLNGILLALVAGGTLWIFASPAVALVIAICVAAGSAWYGPRQLVAHVRTHMVSKERACLRGRHFMETLPAGLRSRCDITDSTVAWAGIRDAIETPDHIFLMLDEMQGYVVPKQAIVAGDVGHFLREVAKFRAAQHNA